MHWILPFGSPHPHPKVGQVHYPNLQSRSQESWAQLQSWSGEIITLKVQGHGTVGCKTQFWRTSLAPGTTPSTPRRACERWGRVGGKSYLRLNCKRGLSLATSSRHNPAASRSSPRPHRPSAPNSLKSSPGGSRVPAPALPHRPHPLRGPLATVIWF